MTKKYLYALPIVLANLVIALNTKVAAETASKIKISGPQFIVAQAIGNPIEQLNKGSNLFKAGKYTDAVSYFSRVIANPKSTRNQKNQALINRSQTYLIIGQPELSVRDLEKTNYKTTETQQQGVRDLILGAAYIQLKRYPLAIQALNSSIRFLPNEATAYSNRAVAYQAINNLKAAAKDLERSLNLDPTPSTVYNLAILQKQKGNYSRCYFLLSKIEETEAAYADVYLQKGICAKKIGKKEQALKDFLKAASLNKFNPLALENIGLILAENGEKKSAISYLEKAAQLYLEKGDIENYTKITEKLMN